MTYFTYPGVPTSNMASSQPAGPGLNMVSEYMASGLPYVSSSVLTTAASKLDIPYTTNELYFHAIGGTLRVGFTLNGVNGTNFFRVSPTDGNFTFRIRCKEVYVRAETGTVSMSFMAAMTQIDNKHCPTLTGSMADPVTGKYLFQTSSLDNVVGYNGLG
jgi:hypothetical protein